MGHVDQAPPPIYGNIEHGFERVREAFIENFTDRGEVGAAVCVYKDGKKVVDLWGGHLDEERTSLWQEDTIVCMMSVAKSVVALGVHLLIERGQVELDAPVMRYWEKFGQAGKSDITVRDLLGGRAGVLYADAAPKGSMFDWDVIMDAIEKQPAERPEEGRGAYHSLTMGFLLSGLIEHVDGRRVDVFIEEELCGPLGVDYQFGLSDADFKRTSMMISNKENATMNIIIKGDAPESNLSRAYRVMPRIDGFFANTKNFLQIVFPSGNGVGNARAIARLYGLLAQGGTLDGVRLFSPETVERMRTLQWTGPCGMTMRDYRYGLGFFLNQKYFSPMGTNPKAFGHMGAGGATGFADPEAGLSFSYSPNLMCSGEGIGDRAEALIDALYSVQM